MAFNINKFAPVGGQSTRGASPQVFTYNALSEEHTVLEADGYFNGAKTFLEVDDILLVIKDNHHHIYHVASVPLNGDITLTDYAHKPIGQYYMQDNTTETVISTTDVFVKAAGTTSNGVLIEGFDQTTSNRALYTGKLTNYFKVSCTLSITNGSNKSHKIRLAKNGTTISSSEEHATTGSGGRAENVYIHDIIQLEENDYIELYVANSSNTTNITVVDLNLIIERVN